MVNSKNKETLSSSGRCGFMKFKYLNRRSRFSSKHTVGAVCNRAGVDSKLPKYFFNIHTTAPVWSVSLILRSIIIYPRTHRIEHSSIYAVVV